MIKKPQRKEDAPNLETKAYILDTSVLIHDPNCIFQFQEHDVYIPMKVLEELDNKKSGHSEPARNARQAVRHISSIMQDNTSVKAGVSLPDLLGKLFLITESIRKYIPPSLSPEVADNHIIGAAFCIQKRYPLREVIVVSNDIALRTKAMACDLRAQEYLHDRVVEDIAYLPSGIQELPEDFWENYTGENIRSWKEKGRLESFYRVNISFERNLRVNEYIFLEKENADPFYARVTQISSDDMVTFSTIKNYFRCDVWGIRARNREQLFALDALLNPEIDLVSILGQAGSGKTLLALAAGLHQSFDLKRYREIIMTRATIPIGDDIGFLPGTEEEKMTPWLGALMDNLEVLCPSPNTKDGSNTTNGNGEGKILTHEILKNRIKVKSMNFMRGRTLNERYLIVDEAQNLTPKQVKTLVTRAGPGTKVVLLGNNAQIDTPYLTETNSGITYAVQQFLGWKHSAHIILARCERSRLADHAEEVL